MGLVCVLHFMFSYSNFNQITFLKLLFITETWFWEPEWAEVLVGCCGRGRKDPGEAELECDDHSRGPRPQW